MSLGRGRVERANKEELWHRERRGRGRRSKNGGRTKKREKVTRNVNVNEGGAALGEPSPRGATRYIPHREGGCAKRPHRIGLMQMCRAPPSRARGVFALSVHRAALAGRGPRAVPPREAAADPRVVSLANLSKNVA